WIAGWIKRKWKDVKNPDLWKPFIKSFNRTQQIMQWVKGDNDHPINERCDALAVGAALYKSNHLIDEGFEATEKGLF
ncbi:ribonuclease HI, partial [Nonlabens mediterrranea]|nr:ribonuclease HI [Nonlabens mediterrranea]